MLSNVPNLIWPPRSLLSAARVGVCGTIEQDLWQALDFLYGPCCNCCGVELPEATNLLSECPACIAQKPAFDSARAALRYDDISKPMVLAMKHAARKDGVKAYANWMMEASANCKAADLIIPVPLHWTRLWVRGYNQAGWLAKAVAERSKRHYAPLILHRKRRTPSQNGLSASGRRRNVEGVFQVSEVLNGKSILLIDDVYTTGATLNACARELKRAGAGRVDCLALARVMRPTAIECPLDPVIGSL